MLLENQKLRLHVSDRGCMTLSLPDRSLSFTQKGVGNLTYLGSRQDPGRICAYFTLDGLEIRTVFTLLPDFLEITLGTEKDAVLTSEINYPGEWLLNGEDTQVMAYNEGIAFRADDPSEFGIQERCSLGAAGCSSMSLWGILRGQDGWFYQSALTNADCDLILKRGEDGLWHQTPRWISEKGRFGYTRVMRIALGLGGLTGLASSYRALAEERGLIRTLSEKAKVLPSVDRFRGVSNVWLWNDDAMSKLYDADAVYRVPDQAQIDRRMEIADDMKNSGMDKVLWSIFDENLSKSAIDHVKALGFLTSTYDIYTDVIPRTAAEKIPDTRRVRCAHRVDWWPKGILIKADGSYQKAWQLKGKDGVFYDQHCMCDAVAYDCAKAFIPARTKQYGLDGWFFDVQTIQYNECYSPEHPMTHREAIGYKKKLLNLSTELGMFCGTEIGGEDYAADMLYNEGMMSPPHFRAPDAGRRMTHLYYDEQIPAKIKSFMLNPVYRIPLWEMIYHDTCVSYWYWGDSSNSCPQLMEKRNLFNLLYGLPGLYSFRAADWELLKEAILASHKLLSPVAEKTCGSRMTFFTWLTTDKTVQRSSFGDLLTVTVNLGENEYFEGERILPPGGYWIDRPSQNA